MFTAIVILANAVTGLLVSLLYYPNSPSYIFRNAVFDEIWLWSKYSAFLAALLFIFAILSIDRDMRGRELARSLSAFTATLQGILNLPPVVLYYLFLHNSIEAKLTASGSTITISAQQFYIHLTIVVFSWASASWLALGKKNYTISETASDTVSEPTCLVDTRAG